MMFNVNGLAIKNFGEQATSRVKNEAQKYRSNWQTTHSNGIFIDASTHLGSVRLHRHHQVQVYQSPHDLTVC